MTRLVAALLFATLVTNVQAQDATYDPPNVPLDIIAPSGHAVRRVSAG